MNKTVILLAVIALIATGSYFVFAQNPMGGGMMGGGTQGRSMRGAGVQNRGMMGLDGMMGTMMRSSSLVAGPDGGVTVLMGNELIKYDKDLNLVKQVEINFNWDNWQKMMMQHRNMMMNWPQQSGSQSSQGE